ncbi:zinc finger protein 26-like isoform X2 [Leptidea sinapis]|uniref:zinc finger protein 26-like isoform X2 n=1 Tax=Leptidea sinapis TaxID=189913 RepID=UPI0021C2B9FD|nr:zinc finger protein 26-like isoform X2 [Leptidea sinapis]
MDGKSSNWRPGPSVCRCCLSDGCYKDIATEYFWMGKREVYEEMLVDTLGLTISFGDSNAQHSQSRLICETCISRLRNATDFKKQVKECEQTFLQYLNPSTLDVVEDVISLEKEEKQVTVKEEKSPDHGDDFNDNNDFLDDDNDDELDDQPLMNLATKVPKKESVDVFDLLDNAKPLVKRKSTTKAKTTSSKKAKIKETKTKPKEKPEKKKKGNVEEIEGYERKNRKRLFERSVNQNPQRRNAVLLLKYSSAIPFKTRFNRIVCSYCHDELVSMEELRHHVNGKHSNADHNSAFYKVGDYLKVDITNFKCNFCMADFEIIDSFMRHISSEHDKIVDFDVPFGVLPFKQTLSGVWTCFDCDKIFQEFPQFNCHLRSHVKIFTCDKCGATFLSDHGLKQHERHFKCYTATYKPRFGKTLKHRSNTEIILKCSTALPFRIWGQNFNCIFCRVQSGNPNGLRAHMATRHANFDIRLVFNRRLRKEFLKVDITNLQCKLCFIQIESLDDLMMHLRNDHKQPINFDAQPGVLPFKLNDGTCWNCAICKMTFVDFVSLKQHTSEHYQNYVCDACGEGFVTEAALRAHKRKPHDNKYNCSRCVATFSTLDERSAHMKSQHTSMPYMCMVCKDKPRFATWELRKRHFMELHNFKPGADAYECTTCHMTFKTRSQKYHHNVKSHRSKKDTDYGFPCTHCSRAFMTKISLDKHMSKKHFSYISV